MIRFRNGRAYYYRSKRQGHNVISEYCGTGELAELAQMMEAEERQEQEAKRAAERQEREAAEEQDRRVKELCERVNTITRAALIAAGHHQHKGTWRKTRGGNGNS